MSARVLLDLDCCPAGRAPDIPVRGAGGKALVVRPDRSGGPLRDDGTIDAEGWPWRLADLVGLHREALLAGCPVPFADEVALWARVADEVDAQRWDAVVVPVAIDDVGALLDAPGLLVRVLDARLDTLAPLVGEDSAAAARVVDLLALRPALERLRALASTAGGAGDPGAHRSHGCPRPGGLGLAAVDPAAVDAAPVPGCGVRADGDGFVWWALLPDSAVPDLHLEADHLVVDVGRERRTLPLPAALARCDVSAATVVGDRLEVRFTPDPDEWR